MRTVHDSFTSRQRQLAAAARGLSRYFASKAWTRRTPETAEYWSLHDARAAAEALEVYWRENGYGHASNVAAACVSKSERQDTAA